MKRTLAILLCAVLLLSSLPILSAGAKDVGVQTKFRMLLEDMEITYPYHQPDKYYCDVLKETDGWVLIHAGLSSTQDGNTVPEYRYATVGNKLVYADRYSEPFKSGFGVYDVKSGAFYDLTDAWNRSFAGLRDAWNAQPECVYHESGGKFVGTPESGCRFIGDADLDGDLTILDATKIQRYIAELDHPDEFHPLGIQAKHFFFGWPIYDYVDYDRDGDFTILDATKLQRWIAELPNILAAGIVQDARGSFFTDDHTQTSAQLLTDRKALENFCKQYSKDAPDSKYNDAYFKKHSLAGVYLRLSNIGFNMELNTAQIEPDGTLNLDFSAVGEEGKISPMEEACFILVELDNAFLDDIRDVNASVKEIFTSPFELPVMSIVEYGKAIARPAKADAEKQGYKMLDSERAFKGSVSANGSRDLTGYIAVIKTPEQLNYIFTEKTRKNLSYSYDLSKYNEKFFKNYALVAAVHRFYDTGEDMRLSHLAVKGNTLYGELDRFTPADVSPLYSVYIDVHQVKRSDIEKVTQAALWTSLYSHEYLYDAYESSQKLPEHTAYATTDKFRRVDILDSSPNTASDEKDRWFRLNPDTPDSSYGKSLVLLYNPTQRDHLIGKTLGMMSDASFEDYAYLALDYADQINGARITDIFTDGSTLEVYVCEDAYSGGEQWRYSNEIVKLKKSDLAGVKQIRMYSDTPFSDDTAKIVLNTRSSYHGEEPMGELITDRAALDAFAGKYLADAAGRESVKVRFCDAYFKQYSLIGVNICFASGGYEVSLDSVAPDGTVNLKYKLGDKPATQATTPVFLLISVSKDNASLIKNITVKLEYDGPEGPESIVREIPADEQRMAVPAEAEERGFRFISVMPLKVEQPQDVYWSTLNLSDNDNGYVMLIKSRAEFEKLLPGFDPKGQLNDQFFEQSAVLVAIGQGTDADDTMELDNIMTLEPDGILFSNPYIMHHTKTVNGEPVAEPLAPICLTFRRVSQMDVRSINELMFFKKDKSAVRALDFKVIEKLELFNANLDEGDNLGVHIKSRVQADGAIAALCTDRRGDIAVDDVNFRIKNKSDAWYADNDVIALRVCEGGGSASISEVKLVYGVLNVTVERRFSNTPPPPISTWQRFFLSIPSLNMQYPVVISVKDTWEDAPFVQDMTDDRKVASAQGKDLDFEILPTSPLSFEMTWTDADSEFLSRPDQVALIKSYDQYRAYFSTKYFKEYDGEPHIFERIAGGEGVEISEEFFEENELIVGVSRYSIGMTYLLFDKIIQNGTTNLFVRFNRYDDGDLYENEPYAAPIKGYCFAAARVPKDSLHEVYNIFMLPDIKVLPNHPLKIQLNEKREQMSKVLAVHPEESVTLSLTTVETVDGSQNVLDRQAKNLDLSDGWFLLIRSYDEFQRHFAELDTEGKYDKAFFDKYALLAVYGQGSDTNAAPRLTDAVVFTEDTLYADAQIYDPTPNHPGGPTEPSVWTFKRVEQHLVANVRELRCWDTSVSERILPNSEREYIPDNPEEEGCRTLEPKELNTSLRKEWESVPLIETDTGYTFLINTRSDVKYYNLADVFPSTLYDNDYFAENALIVTCMVDPTSQRSQWVGDFAVKGSTLYVNPSLSAPQYVTTNTPRLLWKAHEIKKSELGAVDSIRFWRINYDPHTQEDPLRSEIVPTGNLESKFTVIKNAESSYELWSEEIDVSAPSGYETGWYGTSNPNEIPLKPSSTGWVLVLKSRAEFEEYFPGFDKEKQYGDSFFKDWSVVAMVSQGGDDCAQARLSDLAVVDNSTLYADPSVIYPYPIDPENGLPIAQPASPMIWTFRKVRSYNTEKLKSIKYWKTDVTSSELPAEKDCEIIPDDASAEGYSFIRNTKLTSGENFSSPQPEKEAISRPKGFYSTSGWSDFGQLESTTGYLYLIRTKEEFEKCFPGFTINAYKGKEEEYFETHALVAMLGYYAIDGQKCDISCIAVKGNTLYADTQILFAPEYFQSGSDVTYGVAEWASVIWTFAEVNQEDVKNVANVTSWRTATQLSGYVTGKIRVLKDQQRHQTDYPMSKETLTIHATSVDELRDAIDRLYTDENGQPIADHPDEIPQSLITQQEENGSIDVIALRVYRGTWDTKLDILPYHFAEPSPFTTDARGTLTLDIMRYVPDASTTVHGDMCDIMILQTPNAYVGDVKVNVYSSTVPGPLDPAWDA